MSPIGFDGLAGKYGTILIDPPWRFANRTGKMAPEHKRLRRYPTMSFEEIAALPISNHAMTQSHLYMGDPRANASKLQGKPTLFRVDSDLVLRSPERIRLHWCENTEIPAI